MPRPSSLAAAALLSAWGLVAAAEAAAQPAAPDIPDAVVERMLKLGLENIHRAVCDGFNPCTPATPQELEFPPITMDQARAALATGTRSAVARWCGLDADRRSLMPMTRQLRQKLGFSGRQVALVVIIHGIQQGIVAEQLKARGACDPATRSQLDAQLPKG
jgi:hypothetical protein